MCFATFFFLGLVAPNNPALVACAAPCVCTLGGFSLWCWIAFIRGIVVYYYPPYLPTPVLKITGVLV